MALINFIHTRSFPSILNNKLSAGHTRIVGIFLFFLILGAALRIPLLFSEVYTPDEIHQLSVTQPEHSFKAVSRMAVYEHCQPPLDYLVLLGVRKITGNRQVFFRFHSTVFGVLSIMLTFFLMREMANTRIALLTTALLAVSLFHIMISARLRPYSLALFLSLSLLFLYLIALKQRKCTFWLLYFVSIVLCIWSTAFAFLFVCFHLLHVAISLVRQFIRCKANRLSLVETRDRLIAFVLAVIAISISTPLVWKIKQSGSPYVIEQNLSMIMRLVLATKYGFLRLVDTLIEESYIPFLFSFIVLALGVTIVFRRYRKYALLSYYGLASALGVSIFFAFTGEQLTSTDVADIYRLKMRYLLLYFPFMLGCIGLAIEAMSDFSSSLLNGLKVSFRLPFFPGAAMILLLFSVFHSWPDYKLYFSTLLSESPHKQAAALLLEHARQGDVVTALDANAEDAVAYFLGIPSGESGWASFGTVQRRTVTGKNSSGPFAFTVVNPYYFRESFLDILDKARGVWVLEQRISPLRVRGHELIEAWTEDRDFDSLSDKKNIVLLKYYPNSNLPEVGFHRQRFVFDNPYIDSENKRNHQVFTTILPAQYLVKLDSPRNMQRDIIVSLNDQQLNFSENSSCKIWINGGQHRLTVRGKGASEGIPEKPRFVVTSIQIEPESFVNQFGLARQFTFADKIECLGILKDEVKLEASGDLKLRIAYRALTKMNTDYAFAYLVPIRGHDPWISSGSLINGLYPTSRWSMDEIVIDEISIPVGNIGIDCINQIWISAVNNSTYFGSPEFHLYIDGKPGNKRGIINLPLQHK
jgi:uncharacterized membrane protein